MREVILSYSLFFVFGGGFLLFYLSLQPGTIKLLVQSGILNLTEVGLLAIIYDVLLVIMGLYLFYWGLKTWLNAPVLIKGKAALFFIGMITSISSVPIYLLGIAEHSTAIFLSGITISAGTIIFNITIIREPKLLYIFPFTIYRILVKDQAGYLLYDHDWSDSDISDEVFMGFINAVQLMSEEVIHLGGLLDINLTEGMLILYESEYITVGLVSSKSSKLLRDSLVNFSDDFEMKFQRELKKNTKDREEYETAHELIEKYFSNFPYKLIKSRKQPLMLMTKYKDVPIALENKLKEIFEDEDKYNSIKEELVNTPYGVSPTFFDLYNDLENKSDQTSEEESK